MQECQFCQELNCERAAKPELTAMTHSKRADCYERTVQRLQQELELSQQELELAQQVLEIVYSSIYSSEEDNSETFSDSDGIPLTL